MCGGASIGMLRALLGDPKELERELAALQNNEAQTSNSRTAAAADNETVVIYRGTILTMASGQFNPVEAMAVRGDTIVATGSYDQVQTAVSHLQIPYTKERDLGSLCIMPGFVEPHLHLLPTALVTGLIDMWHPAVGNLEQAKLAIGKAVKAAKPGEWIIAFGYDPSLTSDHAALTRSTTDAVAPNNPFFCGNPSGHIGYVNKAAFNAAGIAVRRSEATSQLTYPAKDPYFVKANDEQGEYLMGVVLETAATKITNAFPATDRDALIRRGSQALESWARAGCTTVFDAGIGLLQGIHDVPLITQMLVRRPSPEVVPILPRYHGAIVATVLDKFITSTTTTPSSGLQQQQLPPPPYTAGPLTLYTVKFFLDGSTQGFTAALNEPYSAETNPFSFPAGFLDYRKECDDLASGPDNACLLEKLRPVVQAGWQAMLHVNGARAIDQALHVLPLAIHPSGPQPLPYMHRLEHFTADVTPSQITTAAKLGLGVSHLIAHVGTWGDAFADNVFKGSAPERAARIDPFAEEVAAGLTVSMHSDSFTSPVGPLRYVDTAVTRRTPSGRVLGPEQRVGLEQAFAAVTYNPARQIGQGERVGSLEAGKKADFVVLSRDPRGVELGRLSGPGLGGGGGGGGGGGECEVVETWIGGVRFGSVW